ncbi:MAG: sensor histidine kinase [Erysipelotrichaceae bacterium]|nr:sensor histidine kinase [Erysipelotrichaceae bacterium]
MDIVTTIINCLVCGIIIYDLDAFLSSFFETERTKPLMIALCALSAGLIISLVPNALIILLMTIALVFIISNRYMLPYAGTISLASILFITLLGTYKALANTHITPLLAISITCALFHFVFKRYARKVMVLLYKDTTATTHLMYGQLAVSAFVIMMAWLNSKTGVSFIYVMHYVLVIATMVLTFVTCQTEYEQSRNGSLLNTMTSQLARQLNHYEEILFYQKGLTDFRHEFMRRHGKINELLDQHKILAVQEELNQINAQMGSIKKSEPISNNYLVDAILQDTKRRCEEQNIRFEGMIWLPQNMKLNELATCQVMTNLADNAIEAVSRLNEPDKRWIRVDSFIKGKWIAIRITNPYKHVIARKGLLATSKDDKLNHGLGTRSIRQIIEESGGVYTYNIDEENKIFTTTITLRS